ADLAARMRRLDVPAGGEDPVAGGGDDADAELRIVAQRDERVAQQSTRCDVDGVDFGAVERDLQNMPAPLHPHRITHRTHSEDCRSASSDFPAKAGAQVYRTVACSGPPLSRGNQKRISVA